jgi:hypothetical protein
MFIRLRFEDNPENEIDISQPVPVVSSLKRSGLRYHFSMAVNKQLTLQSRIELIRVRASRANKDNGIMLYQDVEFRTSRVPLTMNFRFAWFDTDTYESRIYAYEQDMTQGFSFSPLYSRGYRTYLMLRYDIGFLSCRLRFSQSNYLDKEFVGSGWDKIYASTRSEFKLMVTARF